MHLNPFVLFRHKNGGIAKEGDSLSYGSDERVGISGDFTLCLDEESEEAIMTRRVVYSAALLAFLAGQSILSSRKSEAMHTQLRFL